MGMVDLAKTLNKQKAAPFDASEFHDRYFEALEDLIAKKAKAKGKKILEDVEEPEAVRGSNVIDLMAALKKSVGGKAESKPAAKKAPAKKAAAKKAEPKAR